MILQPDQIALDHQNAAFWNELCGSGLAQSLGIRDASPASLRRFDAAYLAFYPYLTKYIDQQGLQGHDVLEIGLGYGTLGQLIAEHEARYYGLDIASTPVEMMHYRLKLLGQTDSDAHIRQGSALDIPFRDACFDYVYSIGCLHHTGNLERAVNEVWRVLKPGGTAVIMLYHKNSFRQFILSVRKVFSRRYRSDYAGNVRGTYDRNSVGQAAPYTEYVSRLQTQNLFGAFSKLRIECQNFDSYGLFRGRSIIPRKWFLNNLARVIGLDLYITAQK